MRKLSLLLTLAFGIVLAGCNNSPSAPIAVVLAPATAPTLGAGQTVNVTATVTNDSASKGVTWSLTGAGPLTGQTPTGVTYTAPATIAASSTATVTATSVADPTKTAVLTINLVAITLVLNPNTAQTLDQGTTLAITATVSNDAANKGVTWTLMGAGSLTNQTTTSVTYNAPALVTSASSPAISATSVSAGTKSASVTVNLVLPPSVNTPAPAAGTVGVAYTTSLTATNGVPPYSWSITAGTLPTGLTLSGNTISGMPTAYGTSNFTVQVKDASNLTATASLSIKINPAAVNVTTTTLPNGIVNSAYSATLQSTGGATPITWSISAGALPTGLALAANGNITGTPTTAGTSSFTVKATDSSIPALTATKALSIVVVPVLAISSSSLPNSVTNAAYSATLQSSGGAAPITWSVTTGTLPAGLTLTAGTGVISGTPTTAATSNFTVTAKDSTSPTAQTAVKALSITVVQQLVITHSSLPTGAVNSVYSPTLQSSGGTPTVSWTVTAGTLPAGLTLNSTTGVISGTPTTAGTSSVTVQATDSSTPQQTPTKQFNIMINPVLSITTTPPMPSGTVGTAYSQTLMTNGGGIAPISWSVTVGARPGGLTLNATTGVISGTPTTATGSPFNFTVKASDSGTPIQTSTKALSISIATAPLSVLTTGLPDGVVGQSYSGAMLQSAGGNPPVTWSISVGALPAGLALNPNTGAITGSPTAAGTTFTVMATDSTTPTAQTATKQLTIKVNPVLTVTTTSLPGGTVNTPYSATLVSSGGAAPITWTVTTGALPARLSLNAGSGVISGTPTTVATTNFTVTATDSTSPTAQTAAKALSITVSASGLVITTTSLPSGVVTSNYNQTLQSSGGTNPVTWTITTGTLPAGLTLNAATGSISGTPTTTGMSAFTVKATDSTAPTAQTATANLSITVNTAACGTGGSLTLLKGQYAFAMEGFDGVNPEGIAGVFDADGAGHIAQNVGIYDINDASSFGVHLGFSISSATSSYTIGPDGRGCLVIGLTGGGGTTFRFSLGNITGTPPVASTGHIMQFDNNVTEFKVGILRKQDPTAFSNVQISGNYAFGGTGAKPNSGKYAIAGTFTASGTPSGAITAGQMDTNDNGNVNNTGAAFTYPPTPIAFTGSYNIAAGPSGRGTLTISTGTSTINANVYVVSASELLMLSTDVQTANPLLVGLALQTTQSTFATNSLNAPGIVYTTGLGYNGTTVVSLVSGAIFSPNSFTYNGYQNSGGSISATAPLAGITYSVAANGRVTLVGSSGGYAPIFYLVSPNKGFVLFTDNSLTNPRVESGFMDPQTGGPFTNSSANGTYAFGTMWPSVVSVTQNTGVATFQDPNIKATSDAASPVGRRPNATFTSTYSVDPTGLGVIPAGCSILGGTCQTIFYVISPTKAVVSTVQPTNTNPDLQIADK